MLQGCQVGDGASQKIRGMKELNFSGMGYKESFFAHYTGTVHIAVAPRNFYDYRDQLLTTRPRMFTVAIRNEKDKPVNAKDIKNIKTRLRLVTPRLARNWLNKNPDNRPVRSAHVKRLASDIRADRWLLTHQGIAFNCGGNLLDGQHRLMAVIEADLPVYMLVTTGLPKASMPAVDDHQKRSVGDALAIGYGVKEPTITRATAAAQWLRMGAEGSSESYRISKIEACEFYLKHKDTIAWAAEVFPTTTKGLGRSPVLGALARASYHVDRKLLARFAEVLQSGIAQNKREETIITLRDFLLSHPSQGGLMQSLSIYRKVCRAILAYANRENLPKKHLREVSGEPFPLPEGV